jgi:hypothetical protein
MYKNTYINFSQIDFVSTDTYISGTAYNQTNHYASFNLHEIKDRAQHIFGRVFLYNDMIVHICSMIVPEDSNILISECSKKNIKSFINLLKALVINPPNILFNLESEQRIFNFFISIGNNTGTKSGALYDSEFKNLAGQTSSNIKKLDNYDYKMDQNIGKFIFIPSYSYIYKPEEKKHTQNKFLTLYSIDDQNKFYKYTNATIRMSIISSLTYISKETTPNIIYSMSDTDIKVVLLKKNSTGGYNIMYKETTGSGLLSKLFDLSAQETEFEQMNDNFSNQNVLGNDINQKTVLTNINLIINTHRTTLSNRNIEYVKLIDILFGYS